MSNWWLDAYPAALPGSTVPGQGGYGTSAISYRDPLDAKRSAAGFAPGASYPDGYLGNIIDRRDDKMLGALQTSLNQRSYQRGVHVGSKVGASQYFWNDDMNPDMGLQRQAAAQPVDVEGAVVYMSPRYAPTGEPVPRLAHDGKTVTAPTEDDPSRAARMAKMLPSWSGANYA